jgi:hypothetical protein
LWLLSAAAAWLQMTSRLLPLLELSAHPNPRHLLLLPTVLLMDLQSRQLPAARALGTCRQSLQEWRLLLAWTLQALAQTGQ